MASKKKKLEADNVELRKQVEWAIRELDALASDIAAVFTGRDDSEARAAQTLSRRARFVAQELGSELREGFNEETVGWLAGFIENEFARAVAAGVVGTLITKYGIGNAEVAIGAVTDVVAALGGVGGGNTVPGAVEDVGTPLVEEDNESAGDADEDPAGDPGGDDDDLGTARESGEALPLTVVRGVSEAQVEPTVIQGHSAITETRSGQAAVSTEPATSEGQGTFTPPSGWNAEARATATPGSDVGDPGHERGPVDHTVEIEDVVGASETAAVRQDATVLAETIEATAEIPQVTIGGDASIDDEKVVGAATIADDPDGVPGATARPDDATHGHSSSTPEVTVGEPGDQRWAGTKGTIGLVGKSGTFSSSEPEDDDQAGEGSGP